MGLQIPVTPRIPIDPATAQAMVLQALQASFGTAGGPARETDLQAEVVRAEAAEAAETAARVAFQAFVASPSYTTYAAALVGSGVVRVIDMPAGDWITRTNAAISLLGAAGGVVELPTGRLTFDTSLGQVLITTPVRLKGKTWSPNDGTGTLILIPDTSKSPFLISGPTASGAGIEGMAFLQTNHPTVYDNSDSRSAGTWTPANYPPVIHVQGVVGPTATQDVVIRDCLPLFVNKFVLFDVNISRPMVYNILGQATDYMVSLDNCYDCANISIVRSQPLYYTVQNQVFAYTMKNSDVIRTARCDTPFFDAIFGLFIRSGFYFTQSAGGLTSGFKIGRVDLDHVTYGIYVDASVTGYSGLLQASVYGYVQAINHNGELYTSGADYTTDPTSGVIVDNGVGCVFFVDWMRSIFSASAIQQLTSKGFIQIGNAELAGWGHGIGDGNTPDHRPAVTQAQTNGAGPNRVYFANPPRLIPGPSQDFQNSIAITDGIVDGGPPQNYAPVLSPTSGAFASSPTINSCTYTRKNGSIFVKFDFSITAACLGTAGGTLEMTPPAALGPDAALGLGYEISGTGGALTVVAGGVSTTISILLNNNGSPLVAGNRLLGEFSYVPAAV